MLPTPHNITIGRFSRQEGKVLSVPLQIAVIDTKLPFATVEGMWKKASMLVAETNFLVPAPGFSPQDKMVKSKSGCSPHLITVNASRVGVQYKCDDKCPQFNPLASVSAKWRS